MFAAATDLFAVVELVRDRESREPLSPWPQMHSRLAELLGEALQAGVSFAARGNLVLLAPPLVIGERDLEDALNLLDRLLEKILKRFACNHVTSVPNFQDPKRAHYWNVIARSARRPIHATIRS